MLQSEHGTGGIAYRAYQIGARGHIEAFSIVEAQSEEEAVKKTGQLVNYYAVELWDRGRFIARFEPKKTGD